MRILRFIFIVLLVFAATPVLAQSQAPARAPVIPPAPVATPVAVPVQKPIHMLARSIWPMKNDTVVDCQLYMWTDDGPLSFKQMKEVQGSKLHLILMSPDYKEFYHANPIQTGEGEFRFTIQVRERKPLRLWAIFTNAAGRQVVSTDLNNENITDFVRLGDEQIIQGETDSVMFTIHFPRQVRANVPIDGMLYAQLKNAKLPFTEMEAVRGAYAYFGALSDDFKTMSEIYPTDPPAKDGIYGGPAVHFHLVPAKQGMMRIVAEVQGRGTDMLVPFTLRVAPAFPKGPHVPDSEDPEQIPSPPPDSRMGE